MENCPVCDGEGIELGTLGNLTHYRCRDCGMTFSSPVELKWDDFIEQVAEFLGLR
jgi:transposase-like protein